MVSKAGVTGSSGGNVGFGVVVGNTAPGADTVKVEVSTPTSPSLSVTASVRA